MDNPTQQNRLGLERSFAGKNLGILVNKLKRRKTCACSARTSCTLGCRGRNIASRSRDMIIEDVLVVQTSRAEKEEIMTTSLPFDENVPLKTPWPTKF